MRIEPTGRAAFVASFEHVDPNDATRQYGTTWFDICRRDGGKIAEHWDPAPNR